MGPIHPVQGKDQCWALVNKVMNLHYVLTCHNIRIVNESFENMAKFKYLEAT